MAGLEPNVVKIIVRDGTEIGAAVYMPAGAGPFPALFAASPYRFDNNTLPASPQFLWRETGPIDWYVSQGYAYVHMDVRGSGRSGGSFGFMDRREQEDLYDVIEWIGAQGWSNGNVGGIGQSYYCMLQWFMGALAPPSLKCLAAHDGLTDPYRATCYNGGIPGDFFPGYWWYQNRFINRFPANGPAREQETDLGAMVAAHPLYDDFWRERSAYEVLDRIKVPIYCSGVWSKNFLHTRGVIDGYAKAQGPKKMRMSGVPNAWAAAAEFASVPFHENVLLPFYDHYLKGKDTNYLARPAVEYAVRGADVMRQADAWPPKNTRYDAFYLTATKSSSVTSLNDGSLTKTAPTDAATTSYDYPNPGWVAGVVGFGAGGPASGFDAARRVLTFTTPSLESDLEIAGPIKLTLFASSSATDTDFFIKLQDQFPQSPEDRAKEINPFAEPVSRGWLRASHRAIDPARSTDMEPWRPHDKEAPIEPGKIYQFEISVEPIAYLFKKGHRVRLEIVNGDSPVTEQLWPHYYRPDRLGRDTIHHDAEHPSALILPVTI
jgi:putative CocE/NonD family hydrolase